jgi:MFS family permease
MQSVAVGWQVYELTRDPLHLGWVGLAQFLPMAVLALLSGHVADRVDRKRVLAVCFVIGALASSGLAALAATEPRLPLLYGLLVLIGVGRAFHGPAGSALLPSLVPRHEFANAVAWSSTIWQVATVGGPALGGLLYGIAGPFWVYALTATSLAMSALLATRIAARRLPGSSSAPSFRTLVAGLGYVWRNKIILGAISLDLFAVLLGGAVALLPALARDTLHVGPSELGLMRGAPALGAALMALTLAHRPLARNAGVVMLGSVVVFGAATIVLGISRSLGLSIAALVVLGAADMVSVFVRQTLVQLGTPDEMRGRVSAVNLVFIGASNELGEFESGVTAAWLGLVPAIVAGGIGTIVVVAAYALLFPSLRQVDRLEDVVT